MKLLATILRPAVVAVMVTVFAGVAASAATASPVYYGANVHSLQTWSVTTDQMTQELNALQSAGANAVRVDVSWSALEPSTPGQYNASYLARLDAFMAGAAQRGIKVIATVAATPAWASVGGQWDDAPTDPTTFGNIAAFLAARYGTELAALEAWNEPNWSNNLLAANVPATYTAMVKAFFQGARRGNANVPVIIGAMAYADLSFLHALYADGIRGYYDGVSIHPYADGAAPGDLTVTHSFLGGIESLHAAQLAAGDNTPIWVTEFGWPVGTSAGANTEAQSATYLQQAFSIVDNLSYVRGATVYQLRDLATDPTNPEDNFGLLQQNFTPRPSYAAFTAAMATARAAAAAGTGSGTSGSGTSGSSAPSSGGSSTSGSSTTSTSSSSTTTTSSSSTTTTSGTSTSGTSTSGTSTSGTSTTSTSPTPPVRIIKHHHPLATATTAYASIATVRIAQVARIPRRTTHAKHATVRRRHTVARRRHTVVRRHRATHRRRRVRRAAHARR